METFYDQILDSPSKNSYIGSYYQPPDRVLPRPVEPAVVSMNSQRRLSRSTPDVSSKAVIDALKTLQEKIKRLESERKQAEKNVKQFSQAAYSFEHNAAIGDNQPPHTVPIKDSSSKRELVSQLQSAEARCQVLEKQLDYMRRMVENAEKDKNALVEKQASLQRQKAPDTSSLQTQREKLDKLEEECVKLSKTQSQAELKISVLEQRLMAEEHQRKRVQEKADELQREMDVNLRLYPPPSEGLKPKKKATNKSKRPGASKPSSELGSTSCPKGQRIPFVAGTSTSPSHSVHANMQGLLHMLKHHQPQLCERVRCLQQPGPGAHKNLRRALSASAAAPLAPETSGPERVALSLGSLSDLLLALQDELGQMSFEHQELVQQMDGAHGREDLERELEGLVRRMEEKGVQITKLRRHQQTVHKLNQNTQRQTDADDDQQPIGLRPSPVRGERSGKRGGATQSNLQLLRETQKFRNSLKKDDLSWDT